MRDFEKPLVHVALLDDCARAPAFAVNDLLIGQNRIINGVPIDFGGLSIHQTLVQKFQEDILLLLVIGLVACGEFA